MQIDLHQLMGDEIGDLTGVPQPIEIKLDAADPAQLDSGGAACGGRDHTDQRRRFRR